MELRTSDNGEVFKGAQAMKRSGVQGRQILKERDMQRGKRGWQKPYLRK